MLKGRQLAFRIARATWVDVELQAADFDAFLDEMEPALGGEVLREMATDLFLACACLAGNEVALAEFEAQVLRPAIRAVEQISSEPEFVAHCQGVLWQRLFAAPHPHLKQYRGQDTLLRWVCVVATGTALRAQQQRSPDHQALELTQLYMLASSDSDLAALHAGLGRTLSTAISEALGRLTPSERNVLRMHLAGDCTLDQIGRAYGVHRATAARWLSEARSKVDAAVASSLAPLTDALLAGRNSETQRRAALGYDDSRAPSSSQPGGPL